MLSYNDFTGSLIDAVLCIIIFIFIWKNFFNQDKTSYFTTRSEREINDIMSLDNYRAEPKLPSLYIENFDDKQDDIKEGDAEFVNDRFGQVDGKRNQYNDEQLLQLMYARSGGLEQLEEEMNLEQEMERMNYIQSGDDMNSKIVEKNKRVQLLSKMNDANNMRANRNCLRDDLQMDYEDFEDDVTPWWGQ